LQPTAKTASLRIRASRPGRSRIHFRDSNVPAMLSINSKMATMQEYASVDKVCQCIVSATLQRRGCRSLESRSRRASWNHQR